MKKLMIVLLLLSGVSFAVEPQEIQEQKGRFDKAVKAFEHRLDLWQRCAKRNCTDQEWQTAKSDLLKAGFAVLAIGSGIALYLNLNRRVSLQPLSDREKEKANNDIKEIIKSKSTKNLRSLLSKYSPEQLNDLVTQPYGPVLGAVEQDSGPDMIQAFSDAGVDVGQIFMTRQISNIVIHAVRSKKFIDALEYLEKYPTMDWYVDTGEGTKIGNSPSAVRDFLEELIDNQNDEKAKAVIEKVKVLEPIKKYINNLPDTGFKKSIKSIL